MPNGQLKIQLKMKKMTGQLNDNDNEVLKMKKIFLFSNAVVGESSLDRLACALGGKTVLNYILTTVQTMLQKRLLKFH